MRLRLLQLPCLPHRRCLVCANSVDFDSTEFTAAMQSAASSMQATINRPAVARMVGWLLRQPELADAAAAAAESDDEGEE